MMRMLLGLSVLALFVITSLAVKEHDTAVPASRGKEHIQRGLGDILRDPKDSRKTPKDVEHAPDKRDVSPPKSFSTSLSSEAMIMRAEKVLKAFREYGCPKPEENIYNITVYTADLLLGGTSSHVYINLYGLYYGVEKTTDKIRLTNQDEKEFQRGRVDSFTVRSNFVGLVERITIEHDNTGFFSDWDLHKVVIQDLKLGTVQTFTCDCEIAGYENQVTLPPI